MTSTVVVHELKSHPAEFRKIATGAKRHEVRKADRPFKVGDLLRLREWEPTTEKYTGGELLRLISDITTPGSWGLPETHCVLSLAGEPCGIWTPRAVEALLTASGLGIHQFGRTRMTSGSIAISDLVQALNAGFTGAEFGLPQTQEPKYTVSVRGRLMNRATGVEIPDDEPVFVMRAKDALAPETLSRYLMLTARAARVVDPGHNEAVKGRLMDFLAFQATHPDRVKHPDTCSVGSSIAEITLELGAKPAPKPECRG